MSILIFGENWMKMQIQFNHMRDPCTASRSIGCEFKPDEMKLKLWGNYKSFRMWDGSTDDKWWYLNSFPSRSLLMIIHCIVWRMWILFPYSISSIPLYSQNPRVYLDFVFGVAFLVILPAKPKPTLLSWWCASQLIIRHSHSHRLFVHHSSIQFSRSCAQPNSIPILIPFPETLKHIIIIICHLHYNYNSSFFRDSFIRIVLPQYHVIHYIHCRLARI